MTISNRSCRLLPFAAGAWCAACANLAAVDAAVSPASSASSASEAATTATAADPAPADLSANAAQTWTEAALMYATQLKADYRVAPGPHVDATQSALDHQFGQDQAWRLQELTDLLAAGTRQPFCVWDDAPTCKAAVQELVGQCVLRARWHAGRSEDPAAVDDLLLALRVARTFPGLRPTLDDTIRALHMERDAVIAAGAVLPLLGAQGRRQLAAGIHDLPAGIPIANALLVEQARLERVLRDLLSQPERQRWETLRTEFLERPPLSGNPRAQNSSAEDHWLLDDTLHAMLAEAPAVFAALHAHAVLDPAARITTPAPPWPGVDDATHGFWSAVLPTYDWARYSAAIVIDLRAELLAALAVMDHGDGALADHRDPLTAAPFTITRSDDGFRLTAILPAHGPPASDGLVPFTWADAAVEETDPATATRVDLDVGDVPAPPPSAPIAAAPDASATAAAALAAASATTATAASAIPATTTIETTIYSLNLQHQWPQTTSGNVEIPDPFDASIHISTGPGVEMLRCDGVVVEAVDGTGADLRSPQTIDNGSENLEPGGFLPLANGPYVCDPGGSSTFLEAAFAPRGPAVIIRRLHLRLDLILGDTSRRMVDLGPWPQAAGTRADLPGAPVISADDNGYSISLADDGAAAWRCLWFETGGPPVIDEGGGIDDVKGRWVEGFQAKIPPGSRLKAQLTHVLGHVTVDAVFGPIGFPGDGPAPTIQRSTVAVPHA